MLNKFLFSFCNRQAVSSYLVREFLYAPDDDDEIIIMHIYDPLRGVFGGLYVGIGALPVGDR